MRLAVSVFLCCVYIFSFVGSVSASQDKFDLESLSTSEACKTAYKEADYSGIIKVPATVREDISKYRQAWRKLCDGKDEINFYSLYILAKNIENGFWEVFEQADKITGYWTRNKFLPEKVHEIEQLIYTQYRSFVPLFEGGYYARFFRVSFRQFGKYSFLGSEEDELFFKEFFELRGPSKFPPWIEGLSDMGGCFKFGEYKWVDAFERIEHLEVNVTKGAYKRKINKFKKEMKDSFENYYPRRDGMFVLSSICVCEDKNAVKSDLTATLEYIKGKTQYDKMTRSVSYILRSIENNTFTIESMTEAYCGPR